MAKWIDIGPASDYPEGTQACAQAGGREMVIFNVDGTLYAVNNVCPHAGLPLQDGERRGVVLTCPYHGYAFDIRSGRNIDWPHDEPPVKTYPVRSAAGVVQVQMAEDGDEGPEDESGEEDTQRGPAPAETPAPGEEQTPPCEPSQQPGTSSEPDCPEGYEDRPPTRGVPQ